MQCNYLCLNSVAVKLWLDSQTNVPSGEIQEKKPQMSLITQVLCDLRNN